MTELTAARRVASRAMPTMAQSIADLRALGQHKLADALARVRDEWARTVARQPHEHTALGLTSACRTLALLQAQQRLERAGTAHDFANMRCTEASYAEKRR